MTDDDYNNWSIRGTGALANKKTEELVKECNSDYCVAIEIRNNHHLFELKCVSEYLLKGFLHPELLIDSIPPFTKDAVLYKSAKEESGCCGLLLFSMNFVFCDSKTENEQLAIAWKVTKRENAQENEFAIGIGKMCMSPQKTFEIMMSRPLQGWFSRKSASIDEEIDIQFKVGEFKRVVSRMDNECKSIIIVDFCDANTLDEVSEKISRKSFGIKGIGNLADESINNLLNRCGSPYCVGIQIRNFHPLFELEFVEEYPHDCSRFSEIPKCISPYKKDAVSYSTHHFFCRGLLVFSINRVICSGDGTILERISVSNPRLLAIAWNITALTNIKRNDYAIGMVSADTLPNNIFKKLFFGPQEEWFKRANKQTIPIVFEPRNSDFFTILGSVNSKQKSILLIDFHDELSDDLENVERMNQTMSTIAWNWSFWK